MIHPAMVLHENAVAFIRGCHTELPDTPVLVTSVGLHYVSGYGLTVEKLENGEEMVCLGPRHTFNRYFITRLYSPDEQAPFDAKVGFSRKMLISVVREAPEAEPFLSYVKAEEAAD